MKFLNLTVLLATAFGGANAALHAQCKPAKASCADLPETASASCKSIFNKLHQSTTVCVVYPATTILTKVTKTTSTSTVMVAPITKTKTMAFTKTARGANVFLPTSTTVFKTTKTLFETATSTIPSITTKTTIFRQSIDTTITTTPTSTSLTTSVWEQQTCTPPGGHRRRALLPNPFEERDLEVRDIPDDCSCFLTKTSSLVNTKTNTVTSTAKFDKTITKVIGGVAATSTTTITTITTTSTPVTITPKTTITTTSKTSFTSTITKLWTTKSTSTTITTSKITRTATSTLAAVVVPSVVVENPCLAGEYGRTQIDIPSTGATLVDTPQDLTGSSNPLGDCCDYCYTGAGCIYWTFDNSDNTCHLWSTSDTDTCNNAECPNGYPALTLSGTDPDIDYYPGPCGSNHS